ncbi:molybdopterin-guanine dinucleotide biosynthesis protein B [Dehalococcoidia bacterium]|nr:molybdopterin-guanine dinucleotide biosynthesis protein B [Dehalococcoidia bacterium]
MIRMLPVVCIVGRPKSGKTTLMKGLIAEFKQRGYRVATIKHVAHRFDLDVPGNDSWEHSQAGSDCVVLSSPHKVAIIEHVEHDLSPAELMRFISGDFDIVLAEGFKHADQPKIEVHRREIGELVCLPQELMAVVTDEPLGSVPQFSMNDISRVADHIEQHVLAPKEEAEAILFIDDEPVPLNPFVQNFLLKTIRGMASSLKTEPRSINIVIRRR